MKQLLIAALATTALASTAAAQCSLVQENFDSYPVGTPGNFIPNWTTTGPVSVRFAPPQLAGNALRMNGQGGPCTATMDVGTPTLPDQLSVAFAAYTQIEGTFNIGCPGATRADMRFRPNFGLIETTIGGTVYTTPYNPVFRVDVSVNIDQNASYQVTINGTSLPASPWNGTGLPTCTDPMQLNFTSVAVVTKPVEAFWVDDICLNSTAIGTNYCIAANNATGVPGVISASGSTIASQNMLTLTASSVTPNEFGMFLVALNQGYYPGTFGTSNGNLCLNTSSPGIGRYDDASQIMFSGPNGTFSLAIDLTALPLPNNPVAVMAGETWNFQAWHREQIGLGSNFTDAIAITFQ